MEWELIQAMLIIIGIDIVLGGDNAIVIALASRNLPEKQRNKAILFGTGLAIIVRVLLTAVALYLLHIPFLRLIGGVLLIYIAIKLLTEEEEEPDIKASDSLLSAIKTIVFADIVMGFDNVIAIAGASHDNILLVAMGLLVSVPIIIWGSKIILRLMERFPSLVYIGAGILAYTAAEMIMEERRLRIFFEQFDSLQYVMPLVTIFLVIAWGYRNNNPASQA
ncbi:membrane protein [Thalassobacillus devorans]|uniref:Membrane protein n=1 Tax=Thalassobacillus devorans TaxID=279813 RepID=A0ABQ1NMB7_9BACI|nr:TerC family protein [Thalassobacillus devorans]NIK27075.1 YjbE family integral membrane protein [Thalassobacillus devorans]GGC74716.1 membrane protein [Thalassobacillus devorans]